MSNLEEVEALLKQQRKIHAIKRLREVTGLGLKDSKDMVDHFHAHGSWPSSLNHLLSRVENELEAEGLDMNDLERRVREHWADGMKITAIKIYREETGISLKESKAEVELICEDIVSEDDMSDSFGFDDEVSSSGSAGSLEDSDINQLIIDWMLGHIKRETGVDVSQDSIIMQRVENAAENATAELRSVDEVEINIPFLMADDTGPIHFQETFHRSALNRRVEPVITSQPQTVGLPSPAPSGGTLPEFSLPEEHSIWAELSPLGLTKDNVQAAEGTLSLEDGVVILDAQHLRFFSNRFERWTERESVLRGDILNVKASSQFSNDRLEVRHKKGVLRFQGLSKEAVEAFLTHLQSKPTTSSVRASEQSQSGSSLIQCNDEKIEKIEFWLRHQVMPKSNIQFGAVIKLLPSGLLRKIASNIFPIVEEGRTAEINLMEPIGEHVEMLKSSPTALWIVELDPDTYADLLADRWEPPTPLKSQKIGFGCLVKAVFVIMFISFVLFMMIVV